MKIEEAEISIEKTGVYVIGYIMEGVNKVRVKIKTQNLLRHIDFPNEEKYSGNHKRQDEHFRCIYFPIDKGTDDD